MTDATVLAQKLAQLVREAIRAEYERRIERRGERSPGSRSSKGSLRTFRIPKTLRLGRSRRTINLGEAFHSGALQRRDAKD